MGAFLNFLNLLFDLPYLERMQRGPPKTLQDARVPCFMSCCSEAISAEVQHFNFHVHELDFYGSEELKRVNMLPEILLMNVSC